MDGAPALRRGWTTGACATGAARAAFIALHTGIFPEPIDVILPLNRHVSFPLQEKIFGHDFVRVGIIKDAGDDPDVTHGALVCATVRQGVLGSGIRFLAGEGVGMVTKPGLPLAVGEPAINPGPRAMLTQELQRAGDVLGKPVDVSVEISIPGGVEMAKHTMNSRLGILGGLSVLGTTGVVIPYSCAAWIATIYEGIDIARATQLPHVIGSTGSTSEATAMALFGVTESALIDMGDFVGGMLKYLRRKPIERVTIAGGFAKLAKLAQGHLDVHSQRSSLDIRALAQLAKTCGASAAVVAAMEQANTGLEVVTLALLHGVPLAEAVARTARNVGLATLDGAPIMLDVLVVDRQGAVLAHAI